MRIETAGKIGLGAFLVVWIGGIVVSLGGLRSLDLYRLSLHQEILVMLNLDDHVEMSKTEDEMAGKPWGGALVIESETGDQHIIPLTSQESKAMIRDGEMECNKHTEEPGCFCEPFPTLKNENIWIHRKRG